MSLVETRPDTESAEWRQRIELAACYRLLAYYKMTDLIYTHSTVRVPGEPGHFLINPYGFRWEEITASSLVKINVDGEKVGLSTIMRASPSISTNASASLPISATSGLCCCATTACLPWAAASRRRSS
jgi:ribulose-5-phosphate 4-epimerase/fuculose-1-phosphate aldolase